MARSMWICLGIAATAITASAGIAQSRSMYHVGLETPVTTTAIVRDVRWVCDGATCTASRDATSPDANVCSAIARRFGRLTSFAVGDQAFDSARLERCNSAAGTAPDTAAAAH